MRRTAPFLLLGVVLLGTGLGAGLGLAAAPAMPEDTPLHPTVRGSANGGTPSHLSTRLEMSRTLVAPGERITATLVVTNSSGHPINLTRICTPGFAVALTSPTYRSKVIFAASCSTQPFIVPNGVSRRSFTVSTTYLACLGPGGSSVDHSLPPCLPGGRLPPLPAGSYRAQLYGSGALLPSPAPVAVRLSG